MAALEERLPTARYAIATNKEIKKQSKFIQIVCIYLSAFDLKFLRHPFLIDTKINPNSWSFVTSSNSASWRTFFAKADVTFSKVPTVSPKPDLAWERIV